MADEEYLNRLSIQVPNYDTRLNMGTPDPDGPFGYTGIALHTNFSFFVDIGRVGLYQSNLGSCWQVGGKWLQWSNQDMYMASTANTAVAGDLKVIIAAGAGQGQVTALTSASTPSEQPRLVEYNNLALHWRVDAAQVALKELFDGGDKKWRKYSGLEKKAQSDYSSPDTTGAEAKHYPGGFLKDMDDLLTSVDRQLYKPDLLRAFEWEPDRYDMTSPTGTPSSYFPMLEPFDPYPPTPYTDNFFSKIYASMMQMLNWMHRVTDVLKRVMYLVTDNAWVKRIITLLNVWQDGQETINAIQNLKHSDLQPYWRDGSEWSVLAGHWPSKVKHTGAAEATSAKATTSPGPWNIAGLGLSSLTLVITCLGRSLTITFVGPVVTVADLAAALSGTAAPAPPPPRAWFLDWGALGPPASVPWQVSNDGTAVTVTDPTVGSASRVVLAGGLAPLFFGGNPKIETGHDAIESPDSGDLGLGYDDTTRSKQIAFGSLPEDIRNQFRPIYNAFADVTAIFDHVFGLGLDVLQAVTGQLQPPSMLGLVAKDGIALATTAPMFGTGGGITFVATGKAGATATGPDLQKFVLSSSGPLSVEKFLKKVLDNDDPLKAALQDTFLPDSAVKQEAMPGNFRVAAQGHAVTAAGADVSLIALGEGSFVSKAPMTVASASRVSIRSYTKSVEVLGKEIRIGALGLGDKHGGKQEVTVKVNVAASDRIDVRTSNLRVYMAEDRIMMGKNDKDEAFVVTKNPHIQIDSDPAGEIRAGYWEKSDFMGLHVSADGGGVSVLTANDKLGLGIKNKAGIDISTKVTVHGDLYVGSALLAKDSATKFSAPRSGGLKPKPGVPPKPSEDKTKLKSKYDSNRDSAKEPRATLDEPAPKGLPEALEEARKKKIEAAQKALGAAYQKHGEILDDAKSGELSPDDIGWKAEHDTVFVGRSSEGS